MSGTPSGLGKDLLGLEFLSAEQINLILDTAQPLKEISERAIKKVPTLRGATIVNLFFEPQYFTAPCVSRHSEPVTSDHGCHQC